MKIILYGAYDRYNYGDNLMPILFEHYIKDEIGSAAEFLYCSILSSDLSKYDCLRTCPIKDVIRELHPGDCIIVVGGEVLGASAGDLYMHVREDHRSNFRLKLSRKLFPKLYTAYARGRMGAIWDYPYIPNNFMLNSGVKVLYNTVGGIPPESQRSFIKNSNYISSRDKRTYDEVSAFRETDLVPDSVLLVSKYFSKMELLGKIKKESLASLKERSYLVIQACPYKIDYAPEDLAEALIRVQDRFGMEIVLLPIGYATGHDDLVYLKKVAAAMGGRQTLLYDLTVWEIMYVIAHSQGFYGTSLHGVITAMSYLVPHYCLNPEIKKVRSFLKTWSVLPYIEPATLETIGAKVDLERDASERLALSVDRAQNIIKNSISKIANEINR